ncbi:MAG TPA: hypothetical protein H9842_00550, partial [Candidatus Agathobaculum merdipullorum]|nr:hypothetical protein [Candidatus Agathobaculum merdipullorum]
YSFGRRIKGRAADFISATRPFLSLYLQTSRFCREKNAALLSFFAGICYTKKGKICCFGTAG